MLAMLTCCKQKMVTQGCMKWWGWGSGGGKGKEKERLCQIQSAASDASRYPMTLMTRGSLVSKSSQSRMPAESSDPSAIMCDYIAADVLVLPDLTAKLTSLFIPEK